MPKLQILISDFLIHYLLKQSNLSPNRTAGFGNSEPLVNISPRTYCEEGCFHGKEGEPESYSLNNNEPGATHVLCLDR